MNILEMLKKDHMKVNKMLEELANTTKRAVKTRETLFADLKKELIIHCEFEEQVFYPLGRENPKLKKIILEGYEEHQLVKNLLTELEELDVTEESWSAKLAVLWENLKHHIKEEEQQVFPEMKKFLSKEQLADAQKRLEDFKRDSMKEKQETANVA